MGRARGQRNAAREKRWPGEGANELRELKRGSGKSVERLIASHATEIGKRQIARMTKPLTLEQMANVMIYGYPDVIESASELDVITVMGGGHLVPKKSVAVYSMPTKAQGVCKQCARPRSEGGSGLCRECFRGNAAKNFQERSVGIEYFLDAYMGRAMGEGFPFIESIRSEPDFAPALIEDISEREMALDLPAAVWGLHPKLFAPRPAKPLFHSNTAFEYMAKAEEQHRIRIAPRSKAASGGKFLKAAQWGR